MRNLGKTNDMVVLKGDFEKGVYKEQLLSEYTNNPFIEALPPIFNEDDVLERFMVTPRISDQDKLSETNIRYHVLKRVKNFYPAVTDSFRGRTSIVYIDSARLFSA